MGDTPGHLEHTKRLPVGDMKHKSGDISFMCLLLVCEEEPRNPSPKSVRHSICSRGIWLLSPWREKAGMGAEARGGGHESMPARDHTKFWLPA